MLKVHYTVQRSQNQVSLQKDHLLNNIVATQGRKGPTKIFGRLFINSGSRLGNKCWD